MSSGTLTPAPAPRVRSDGEGSPVSTKWLVGVLVALCAWLASDVIKLRERQSTTDTAPIAVLTDRVREIERLNVARDLREAAREAQIQRFSENQDRMLRLVVRLAKRSGIEVAE